MSTTRLHLLHHLIQAEACRLLTRRVVLEGRKELPNISLRRHQQECTVQQPVVVCVRRDGRPLVGIATQVLDQRHAQRHKRFHPYSESARRFLLHKDHFPVVITQGRQVPIVGEVENLLAWPFLDLASQQWQHVVAIEMDLVIATIGADALQQLLLDISIAGNVPVPGGKVEAREGMPGLDTVGEIGPELEINLWNKHHDEYSLRLNLPLRAVFSVGDPLVKYQGWNFSPFLQLQRRTGTESNWHRYRLSVGPIFADSKYHNYFYEVEPRFETISRPEYHPDAGYSGSRITLAFARYSKTFFYAAFLRYDSLSNAKFIDSPLVEAKSYLAGGFAFAWIFKKSKVMVEHHD